MNHLAQKIKMLFLAGALAWGSDCDFDTNKTYPVSRDDAEDASSSGEDSVCVPRDYYNLMVELTDSSSGRNLANAVVLARWGDQGEGISCSNWSSGGYFCPGVPSNAYLEISSGDQRKIYLNPVDLCGSETQTRRYIFDRIPTDDTPVDAGVDGERDLSQPVDTGMDFGGREDLPGEIVFPLDGNSGESSFDIVIDTRFDQISDPDSSADNAHDHFVAVDSPIPDLFDVHRDAGPPDTFDALVDSTTDGSSLHDFDLDSSFDADYVVPEIFDAPLEERDIPHLDLDALEMIVDSEFTDTFDIFDLRPDSFLPLTCETAQLCDTGERALNGYSPAHGDSITLGGWIPNGGAAEHVIYSNGMAHAGSMSIDASGYNGSGAHYLFDYPSPSFRAEIWYSTNERRADQFYISSDRGGIGIRTGGFCDFDPNIFYYIIRDGEERVIEPIPGAPQYESNRWYHFRIGSNSDGHLILSVSDGVTEGAADLLIENFHQYDTVQFSVDCCGGCSHTTYWDDFFMDPH